MKIKGAIFGVSLFTLNAFATPVPLWQPSPADAAIAPLIVKGIEAQVSAAATANHGVASRDAHAKGHGCVLAYFEILSRFKALQAGRVYKAAIRYSNGSGDPNSDDRVASARGMAIKVMNVRGEKMVDDEKYSQDFPMINYPAFFVKNATDYAAFSQDRNAFFQSHPAEAAVAAALQNPQTNPPKNLLESTFYSMTPRQFGSTDSIKAVKYSAIPVGCPEVKGAKLPPARALTDSPDALQIALQDSLDEQDACFVFRIQHFVSEELTPINNPVKEWDEKVSPWIPVAFITIPKDLNANISKRKQLCEDLSISPWHSLPELQPLGSIEYVRKSVYSAISAERHGINERPLWEPRYFKDWKTK